VGLKKCSALIRQDLQYCNNATHLLEVAVDEDGADDDAQDEEGRHEEKVHPLTQPPPVLLRLSQKPTQLENIKKDKDRDKHTHVGNDEIFR
jgi:hypothetical protein